MRTRVPAPAGGEWPRFCGKPHSLPRGRTFAEASRVRQPLLGLHGHLHESRGTHTLGRTLCVNPGSEYNEGALRGALFELKQGKVKSHQFTAG